MKPDHHQAEPDSMELGDLLPFLARRLRRMHGRGLEPFGLTPGQFRALGIVARTTHRDGQELRLSRLAEKLEIAPRSATEVVDALQDKGLVQRSPSPTDRRATALTLTPEGTELVRRLRAESARASREHAEGLFSVLSDDERATLTALLRRAAEHLQQDESATPGAGSESESRQHR